MRKPIKLEDAIKLALEKKGKCLSNECLTRHNILSWECSIGHKFNSSFKRAEQVWCYVCNKLQKQKTQYLKLKDNINKRGDILVTDHYVGWNEYCKIQCKFGHVREILTSTAYKGSRCSSCQPWEWEEICRAHFEQIFKNKFPKIRPDWLINPKTGHKLELDGYCEELKLAFEHQGLHHYEEIFDKGLLKQIQEKDKIKEEYCSKRNILLIIIPCLEKKVKIKDLKDFIKKYLLKNRPSILPLNFEDISITLKELEKFNFMPELQQIVKEKDGVCLSDKYLGAKVKLRWKCKEGHEWLSTPNDIKSGYWCPKCGGRMKRTIEDAKQYALDKGGECLSNTYTNIKGKLNWKCKNNHIFTTSFGSILYQETWCNVCREFQKAESLEKAKLRALEHGGKLLSEIYVDYKSPLNWECAKGHIFSRSVNSVSKGDWCLFCKGKKSIKDAQEAAKLHGGECLSTKVKGISDRLKWRCSEGHEWESMLLCVLYRGNWCKDCNFVKRRGEKRNKKIKK